MSGAMGQAILNCTRINIYVQRLVRSIFKIQMLFICISGKKSHNESINYICTYCSKDSNTVCEMQVLSFYMK